MRGPREVDTYFLSTAASGAKVKLIKMQVYSKNILFSLTYCVEQDIERIVSKLIQKISAFTHKAAFFSDHLRHFMFKMPKNVQ